LFDKLAKRPTFFAMTGVLALGFAAFALPTGASAADLEKCYGISKAGQDDGSKEMEVPGMSTVDFQGGAFKYVTKGTCEEISTPFGSGSLKPIANRPPKGK
jgi:uncharacterized membrane protein